jgi:signal transduction histidine kinase
MQADRNSAPESSVEVGDLEATCRRQAREIQMLGETVSVFRKGAHSLSLENARLRGEVGTMRVLAAHARTPALDTDVTEARLPLNVRAPGTARAIVVEFLRDRVPHGLLDRAKLIVSELVTDSVNDRDAPADRFVVLRIESSPTTVRLELDDPGRAGAVVKVDAQGWFGLQVMQAVSESWGGERDPDGGTRTWAQLQLSGPTG